MIFADNGGGGSDDFITTVIIAVIVSVIAPLLLNIFQARSRRIDRREAWEHERERTRMAQEASAVLLTKTDNIEAKMHETHTKLLETSDSFKSQLRRSVHNQEALLRVNQVDLDIVIVARQNEIAALEDASAALRKIMEIESRRGMSVNREDVKALEDKRERIEVLKMIVQSALEEEAKAQARIEAEMQTDLEAEFTSELDENGEEDLNDYE